MDTFRATAFYLMVWQTFLAILAALLIIALNDIEPPTALLIAANLALLFALVLVIRTNRLDERRIARGGFWRTVPARQRPPGEVGLRLARAALEETWLRFAKGAAAAAIILCTLAYASHGVATSAWAQAARGHGETTLAARNAMIGSAYAVRLLPTN
jgi:hypothetical protein